jgi:phage-related protein
VEEGTLVLDVLKRIADALTSLVGIVPGVAATAIDFFGRAVAAAADAVIEVANGVSELLYRVADYLNAAFSE